MVDDFNKSDEDNLASFIRSTRKSNAEKAYGAAKVIYDQIDFKSYIGTAIAKSENSARIWFEPGGGHERGWTEIYIGEEKWSSVITKLCEIVKDQGISCEPIVGRYFCNYCSSTDYTKDEMGYLTCQNCGGCHFTDVNFVKCRGLLISWPSAGK